MRVQTRMMTTDRFRGPRASVVTAFAARVAMTLAAGLLVVPLTTAPAFARASIAQYDAPKYPSGFTHFDYADPNAPTDGTLVFQNYDEAQSYDSLNPFLTRGAPAPDILHLMFDTLMQRSWDELASEYALIADDVEVAPDGKSAVFHIDPRARFSNGDPITADDVKYSFDTLTSPQASPLFNSQFAVISRATVLDPSRVRFDFRHVERDAPLIAGDLPVFSRKWAMQANGTRIAFDQLTNVPPVSSGPYLIGQRKNDTQIVYRRNPAYWAADLPSRRGMYHFARVAFKLYHDHYTQLESLKALDTDVMVEYSSMQWARRYIGKNFENGALQRKLFPDHGAQMQGLMFNTRRPMFSDVRVRHALALAFDYDWLNRMTFYGQYRRTNSYFDDSPFAAQGVPTDAELTLLDPYRASLPAAVFGPMVRQADTIAPHTLRENLREARGLLAEAGWTVRDGQLRDAHGNPMSIEIIDDQPGMDRVLLAYMRNLQLLGIDAHMREIDSALYQKRIDNFDFDMTSFIYLRVTIPGSELERRFSSASASQVGSENYPGVRSPAVDALVRAVMRASTLNELETATHALDRVLINGYYLVPEYFAPDTRIAYKSALGYPSVTPVSFQGEDWIVSYWYRKTPSAAANTAEAK
ncbi:extracellular solute-binding protein [Paraburkholderia sp. WSM4174]|uniref:extracellular solute-binding protein n=2 Tax=Burkholderiaceae TaxID=119060 RepID=UPI003D19D3A9